MKNLGVWVLGLFFLAGIHFSTALGGQGTEVNLGGLKANAPAEWKSQKVASKFRTYQFQVPKTGEDKEDAELVVFYFEGSGGSVEDNIKRWKGFFQAPQGKSIEDVSKVMTKKVGKAELTYLDIHGTFLSKNPPFDPNAKVERRENYRRFGVVFETPKGPYFITLTGPARTLEHHKKSFDNWLESFK